jgi:hypothetical protein
LAQFENAARGESEGIEIDSSELRKLEVGACSRFMVANGPIDRLLEALPYILDAEDESEVDLKHGLRLEWRVKTARSAIEVACQYGVTR